MFNTATRCYEMTDSSGSYDWMVENWNHEDYTEWTDDEVAEYADGLIAQAIENECNGLEEKAYELSYPRYGYDTGHKIENASAWVTWKKAEIALDLKAERDDVISFLKSWRESQ